MDKVERLVEAALERAGYTDQDRLLVVAVSGGPDSLALLHSLVALREALSFRIHVAHLDHDFRGEEAEEDARFVSNVAADLELPATVEKVDAIEYQRRMGISSFEEAARRVRYDFLARVARANSASEVALGHTADDLAESVLMHILRGSGIHGLRGMEEVSTWRGGAGMPGVTLFRPLLRGTKAETESYCRKQGIGFRQDSGNLLLRFTRNRVRRELLPALESYNPRIREALLRLSRASSLEVDYLEQELSKVWPGVAREKADSIALDTRALRQLHPYIQRLALRHAYELLADDTRRLEETHLIAMVDSIDAPAGKTVALPRGLVLRTGYGELTMEGEGKTDCPFPTLEGEHRLSATPGDAERRTSIPGWRVTVSTLPSESVPAEHPFTAHFDPAMANDRLLVRTRLPGDRFQPLGMAGEKKLQDFFVDQKVPRVWRDRVPLVVSERGIMWVVGYRIAEWARVREGSIMCRIRFSRCS